MKTNKSRWYTTGIHGQELDDIQELENISNGTMIFRYLGILLAIKNLNISAWMSSSLLYVGRVVLLRAVLQGVECFSLSSFLISATVMTKITRLCCNFLWRSMELLLLGRIFPFESVNDDLILRTFIVGIMYFLPSLYGTFKTRMIL